MALSCVGAQWYDRRAVVCAAWDSSARSAGAGGRIWEVSGHQNGESGWGAGAASVFARGDRAELWRVCQGEDPDLYCRNTFRLELERDRLAVFVNGTLIQEHRQFSTAQQLPGALVDEEVYVYFGSWTYKMGPGATRFHWDRLGVNPSWLPSSVPEGLAHH